MAEKTQEKGIKCPKAPLELQTSSSSKKRNKKKNYLPEDEHDHKPVLNVKSKKRANSKKRVNSKKRITLRKMLRNKMTLEPQTSSTMMMKKKNLPEEDQLSDVHDHKTVLGFFGLTFDPPLKPEASSRIDENSSEDDEYWNERVIPEGYELSDNHNHHKCIAEQLGLNINRPIPAYCKPT